MGEYTTSVSRQESVKSAIKIYLQRATFAAVAGNNYGGSEVLRRSLWYMHGVSEE